MSTCGECQWWRHNTGSGSGLCCGTYSQFRGIYTARLSVGCEMFQWRTPPTQTDRTVADARDPYGGRD
jgi:hypothetical protein